MLFLLLNSACEGYAQINLDSLLTACYPFNGNADDASGNNHHGTVFGATLTTDRFGYANNAYHFDGINDYIAVLHFDSLVPTNEVSISFWCQVSTFASHSQFQIQPDINADRFNVSVHYYHNNIPSTFWDFGSIFTTGRLDTINIPFVTHWEHYVFISSASQNIMMEYRNGVLLKSENHHGVIFNRNRTLWIGKGSSLSGMEGEIDDIRIYNRVLSPAEVNVLFTTTPSLKNSCSIIDDVGATKSDNRFSLYPNPAGDLLTVSIGQSLHHAQLEIFNALGSVVLRQSCSGASPINVDLSGIPPGIYFLSMVSPEITITEKLIVQ